MFLTEANVLHYLMEKRFAAGEDVVDGSFIVRGLSRRNRNFRVTAGSREYLVKQVKKWDSEGRSSLEREAAVYWQAKTNPALAPVARLAPQCHAWDPSNAILILEYLPAHMELYDLPDRFSPRLAHLAGEAMGAFHRAMRLPQHESLFPIEMPPQLSLHEASEDDMTDSSAGQRELVRAVRKYREFAPALDHLRAEWRTDTMIQGDWKLDNCLIPAERDHVRMVDWEFACWGDAAWDLATLLQSYWNFWVLWPSEYSIEEIQPAIRSALSGYGDPDIAKRAIHFTGARMLQTAFERLEKLDTMTPDAVRLMQGSLNILTRPDWAAQQLLGTA